MGVKQTEALKLALEALEFNCISSEDGEDLTPSKTKKAITAIREVLAEQPTVKQSLTVDLDGLGIPHGQPFQPAQQQEPFGYFRYDLRLDAWVQNRAGLTGTPFYTSPPNVPTARASKPLTDEQILAIGKELGMKCRLGGNQNIDFDYARAIEAAHGIKGDA